MATERCWLGRRTEMYGHRSRLFTSKTGPKLSQPLIVWERFLQAGEKGPDVPRYFLHLQRHDECIPDEEGQEFRSVQEAEAAAKAALCEIAGDHLKASQQIILEAIDIADGEGRPLGTVTTVEALEPLLPVGLAFQKVASETIKYSSVKR